MACAMGFILAPLRALKTHRNTLKAAPLQSGDPI